MASSSHESDRGEEPMEMIQDPEVSVDADIVRSRLDKHREFLEERIDPDFGLLDRLRANKAITHRQFQEISAEKVPFRKSQIIINSILQGSGSDKVAKFLDALKQTKQEHIVNYIHGDGEYRSHFGGNWPLGEAKIDILDDNITFLTENIDSAHGLLACMIQKRAITQRQMEFISVQPEPCKKNEALLEIIRRGSQSEFDGTIDALRASNQDCIADVLIHGGTVLSIHSKADSNLPEIDPAEEEIVHQIDDILQDRTPEESRLILERYMSLRNSGLIAAKKKKSILFFFHCKNLEQLRSFLQLLATEEIQKTIEMIYNKILSTSSYVRVNVTWNDVDYNKAERRLQDLEKTLPVEEGRPPSAGMEEIEPAQSVSQSKIQPTGMEVEVPSVEVVAECESLIEGAEMATAEMMTVTCIGRKRGSAFSEDPVKSDEEINAAILRNNTDFLNQHILPRGVIDKLHAAELLSDEDTRYIKTLRHVSEKNDEILNVIRNTSSERYNEFVSYLRDSGQRLVADVAERGGVVLKLKVTHEPAEKLEEIEKDIVERLKQLQDTTIPKSEELWNFLGQLKRANIEIVSARWDKGIVMWFWCHSQQALRTLDDISMSDTKQPNLLNGLFGLLSAGKSAPTISSVYLENPEKDVVCRKHRRIVCETKYPTGEREAFGVAMLRTTICLLFRGPNAIVVYEEGDLAKPSEDEMPLDGIVSPVDMAYSKESNCIYVTDEDKASVWKIDISSSDKQVELWLEAKASDPFTLSATNDGGVVMVKRGSPSSLDIYHPDARLLHHLVLPPPMSIPNHAVETSKGNFVVSYDKDDGIPGGLCEITRQGQIISRFDLMFESINGVAEGVNSLLAQIAKSYVHGFSYLARDEAGQVYACGSGENGELAIFDSRLVRLEGGRSGLIAPQRIQCFKEDTQLVAVQKNFISVLHMK